ncbi:MAG TPA: branched-chain amino acid transporter permease [Clostridia bacterium]|nr:branched-chain amino acid transporter permease [Clostridia bacterium]
MQLTPVQIILTILAVALGAIATRLTPFVLFPDGKRPPEVVTYLGNVLPPVMMGLLVVYCLKSVPILSYPHGLPELISIAFIVVLHLWRKNVLLSIGCGTALYMFLVQAVFVS